MPASPIILPETTAESQPSLLLVCEVDNYRKAKGKKIPFAFYYIAYLALPRLFDDNQYHKTTGGEALEIDLNKNGEGR